MTHRFKAGIENELLLIGRVVGARTERLEKARPRDAGVYTRRRLYRVTGKEDHVVAPPDRAHALSGIDKIVPCDGGVGQPARVENTISRAGGASTRNRSTDQKLFPLPKLIVGKSRR
jgi:hypothetical protein